MRLETCTSCMRPLIEKDYLMSLMLYLLKDFVMDFLSAKKKFRR